jgi:hypothetical protein
MFFYIYATLITVPSYVSSALAGRSARKILAARELEEWFIECDIWPPNVEKAESDTLKLANAVTELKDAILQKA